MGLPLNMTKGGGEAVMEAIESPILISKMEERGEKGKRWGEIPVPFVPISYGIAIAERCRQ